MKFLKIFSVLALSAVTLNMSAALTAKAQLVFTSNEGYTANYLISQDDAVSSDFTSSNCGKLMANPDSWAICAYTEYNSQKYAAVDLNDINGVVVTFKGNPYETAYTLTLSNVEGNVKVMDGTTEVVSPYSFTCTAGATKQFTIVSGFGQYTRTEGVAAGNFGTICLPKAVAAGDATGATFYSIVKTVEAAGTIVGLELAEETALVAGRPYIFEATANEIVCKYHDNVEELTAGSYNGLVGTYELTTADLVANNAYIIYNNEVRKAGVAAWIGDNRAVIVLEDIQDASATAPARRRVISFTNGVNVTTGVENAELNANAQKMIIDGQMYILRGENIYNMNGQVVK